MSFEPQRIFRFFVSRIRSTVNADRDPEIDHESSTTTLLGQKSLRHVFVVKFWSRKFRVIVEPADESEGV